MVQLFHKNNEKYMSPETGLKFNPENINTDTEAPDEIEKKEISEAELIEKAKSGDTKAWDELIKNYERRLRSFINREAKGSLNLQDMDDIYQDTWTKAFRKIDQFKGGKFHSWLFTIAHRTFLNEIKRAKKSFITPDYSGIIEEKIDPESISDSDGMSKIEKDTETEEIAKKLEKATAILDEEEKEVVLARSVGKSYKTISEKTGVKPLTLASRFHRAKIKMMKVLERLGLNSTYFKK